MPAHRNAAWLVAGLALSGCGDDAGPQTTATATGGSAAVTGAEASTSAASSGATAGATGSTAGPGTAVTGVGSSGAGGTQIGDPCVGPDDCDSPQFCHPVMTGSFCTVPCVPFDQVDDCPTGSHCILVDATTVDGGCFPATGIGTAPLEPCDAGFNACAEDVLCFDVGSLTCLAVCRVALGTADCPAPASSCMEIGGGIGGCAP